MSRSLFMKQVPLLSHFLPCATRHWPNTYSAILFLSHFSPLPSGKFAAQLIIETTEGIALTHYFESKCVIACQKDHKEISHDKQSHFYFHFTTISFFFYSNIWPKPLWITSKHCYSFWQNTQMSMIYTKVFRLLHIVCYNFPKMQLLQISACYYNGF